MVIIQIVTLALLTMLLVLHDTVPLSSWNNVRNFGLSTNPGGTVVNAGVGLVSLYLAWQTRHDHGLTSGREVMLVILLLLLAGEIYSWWMPWLFGTNDRQRRELQSMTQGTVTLVRERHGVTPNALHCVIHLLTLFALAETLALAFL